MFPNVMIHKECADKEDLRLVAKNLKDKHSRAEALRAEANNLWPLDKDRDSCKCSLKKQRT